MNATEYASPRYLVVDARKIQTTEANGTPITLWQVKAHRWIKSRNAFAKTTSEFTSKTFPSWVKA